MKIEVYNHGELDGIAHEDTNEYEKAKNKSFFELITKMPMNFIIVERFLLNREHVTDLKDVKHNGKTNKDGLEFKIKP